MAWHNGYQVWLTESQSLDNAQLVANFLLAKGWAKESISATLGNMRHESSINPNMYEFNYDWSQDRGFGLVQWTPRSKYWDWALDNGYSESELRDGDAQLDRMDYEVNNNIQWIPTPNYPETYAEFRNSTKDLDYLTRAFTWNYERPQLEAGENSMPDRIAFAERCYNELDFSGGGGSSDGTQLAVLPIDVVDISQGEYGSYSHYDGSSQELALDFMARDANNVWLTEYPLFAPFDSEVIQILPEFAQVMWRSTVPVMAANGVKHPVLTYSIIHDWGFDRWSVGDTVKKGESIGFTGNAGNSNGDHLHLQVFPTDYHPWPTPLDLQLHIYDVFDTGHVKYWFRDGGYDWKVSDYEDGDGGGTDPDPPDPDPPDPELPDLDQLFKNLDERLKDMLTTDVHKQGNSDYYKNSFLILQKQLDNSYKIKPTFKVFEDTHKIIQDFINDIMDLIP